MSKLIALILDDGLDGHSCEHLIIPDEMDLKEQKIQHEEWYKNVYRIQYQEHYLRVDMPGISKIPFYTLSGWMIKNGARYATSEEVEEVEEEDL